MEKEAMKDFCHIYKLNSLNNKSTCYKNPANPACIDLILTNCPKYLQNTTVIQTKLSEFHIMVVTIMKTKFPKLESKMYTIEICQYFTNKFLPENLVHQLLKSTQ